LLGEKWLEKERKRVRSKYVPVAKLPAEKVQERRLQARIHSMKYRTRHKPSVSNGVHNTRRKGREETQSNLSMVNLKALLNGEM